MENPTRKSIYDLFFNIIVFKKLVIIENLAKLSSISIYI